MPKLTDLRDLDKYLATVKVETDAEPQPFASVADPWQLKSLKGITPAIERLVNERAPEPTVRRCMWIRPRGHAKTADAAMLVARVLAFSRRRRRGVWVASDKDQGCEGLDSIATLCRHNPWLDALLTIRADKVENARTGSVLYFTTSDVSSAFGWKDCDLFIMDEVTHWPTKGEDLWTAMYSAAGKRKNAIVFALMNAGMSVTWQRGLRDKAAVDPSWAFSELPDAVASWISPKQLEDQAKYIPRIAFDRLWRNQWSSGAGDVLDPADVGAAFHESLAPMTGNEQGFLFVAGVDLGLTRDCSAVVVLAIPSGGVAGRIRLAHHKVWCPVPGQKINLLAIEKHLLELDAQFGLESVVLDPWQAESLAQRLEADTTHRRRNQRRRFDTQPWARTVPPTGANLREQASLTIESFTDRRLMFYPCQSLRNDLMKLRCEEKSYGFRLVSPRDESGHGDSFSAFALALLVGHELAGKRPITAGALDFSQNDDLSQNYVKGLENLIEYERELFSKPYTPEIHNFKVVTPN